MKRYSTSTGPTTAANAQCSSGELSPMQRIILRSLRNDGPGTEAEIFQGLSIRKKNTMVELRADLHELELRHLVRCETQANGRRLWGMA